MVSLEQKKEQAIKLMNAVKLNPKLIEKFKKTGSPITINLLSEKRDIDLADVEKFEDGGKNKVYLIIESTVMGMPMQSYLFVSDYIEDWDLELESARDGYLFSYTRNLLYPEFSEYGSIVVEATPEGLLRRLG